MSNDPSQDKDFLAASPQDQHNYLMATDPDYAKASPTDQHAYLDHVSTVGRTFQAQRANAPKTTGEALKRAALAPLTSDFWSQAGEAGKNMLAGAGRMAESVLPGGAVAGDIIRGEYGNAATDVLPGASTARQVRQTLQDVQQGDNPGRNPLYRGAAAVGRTIGVPVSQMEQQADVGSPEGVVGAAAPITAATVAPSIGKFAARATLPIRTALAERIVQPLVYEGVGEAGADTRLGIQPERALVKEGIWGRRQSMVDQANQRLSQLKPAANQILQTAPGASTPLDATGAINSAVNDAIDQAYKNGQGSIVPRLEELRDSLLTQHGGTTGAPLDINNLKTSIQDTASQLGAFKNTVPAEASAAGAAGRAASNIRGQVNTAVPEAAPLNERMADLMDARSGLQRGIEAEKGRDIFSGSITNVPNTILRRTVGSPLVRSGAARLLSLGAKADIPSTPPTFPGATPNPFPGANAPPVQPPPVPPQYATQGTGTVTGSSPGLRGAAGTRIAGLLPEDTSPNTTPPNAAGAVETAGVAQNPQVVESGGQPQGVIVNQPSGTGVKGLLPAPQPPPTGPVGRLPTLSGPVTNPMWGVPSPMPQVPGWAVPDQELLGPWGQSPVPSPQGAPPSATPAATPETTAASPGGGSQVPPTLPSTDPVQAAVFRELRLGSGKSIQEVTRIVSKETGASPEQVEPVVRQAQRTFGGQPLPGRAGHPGQVMANRADIRAGLKGP